MYIQIVCIWVYMHINMNVYVGIHINVYGIRLMYV